MQSVNKQERDNGLRAVHKWRPQSRRRGVCSVRIRESSSDAEDKLLNCKAIRSTV